jgi:hypothetical protein
MRYAIPANAVSQVRLWEAVGCRVPVADPWYSVPFDKLKPTMAVSTAMWPTHLYGSTTYCNAPTAQVHPFPMTTLAAIPLR